MSTSVILSRTVQPSTGYHDGSPRRFSQSHNCTHRRIHRCTQCCHRPFLRSEGWRFHRRWLAPKSHPCSSCALLWFRGRDWLERYACVRISALWICITCFLFLRGSMCLSSPYRSRFHVIYRRNDWCRPLLAFWSGKQHSTPGRPTCLRSSHLHWSAQQCHQVRNVFE